MELVKHEDTVTEIERALITSIRRVDGEHLGVLKRLNRGSWWIKVDTLK